MWQCLEMMWICLIGKLEKMRYSFALGKKKRLAVLEKIHLT